MLRQVEHTARPVWPAARLVERDGILRRVELEESLTSGIDHRHIETGVCSIRRLSRDGSGAQDLGRSYRRQDEVNALRVLLERQTLRRPQIDLKGS